MKQLSIILFLSGVILFAACQSFGQSDKNEPVRLKVYHIGNSLTRNIPLEKLQALIEYDGGSYDYGMQLGGGHQLDQHLSKRNHGNKPGEGKYNTVAPYGEYDFAFKNFVFDAAVLQPYKSVLDKQINISDQWPYFEAGALQAASEFIDYALGNTEPGSWYFEHANSGHQATKQFYIYATWPNIEQILSLEGEKTYAAFYAQSFEGGGIHCKGYFEQLVTRLNELHPELENPVKLIPAGQVLAELDEKIRNNNLPGIEEFFQRNQGYFINSRRNNKSEVDFDPNSFQPEKGVLNFYADNIHLNDQPHNGENSGTIGSYCAAITFYSVLGNRSPVGLSVEPYEMFNPVEDAQLIKSIQETVWDVVNGDPLTGVIKNRK